jgi:hypothetical protein
MSAENTDQDRFFIRFGDVPEGGKSLMWTAPNIYINDKVGQVLPGLSAYEVTRDGDKWVLITDTINVGSGIASLNDCFHRAVMAPNSNPVYLLKGNATTWENMTREERNQFEDWYPGEGNEGYVLEGTDGEPLVRDFTVISTVKVTDLTCAMIDYPEDWDGLEPHEELAASLPGAV